jgi:hypothetical protein
VNVPFFQPPDQVQRLVGGDAAADDQGDASLSGRSRALGRGGAGRSRCRGLDLET